MKIIPILIGLAGVSSAQAAVQLPEVLGNSSRSSRCAKAVQALLAGNGAKGEWIRQVDPRPGIRSYRSPTRKLGRWVELEMGSSGVSRARIREIAGGKDHVFSANSCKPSVRQEAAPAPLANADQGPEFTDRHLQALLDSNTPALIYVWTPRMVYSLIHMDVFRKVAQEKGLAFIPLLDPAVPVAQARAAAAKAKVSLQPEPAVAPRKLASAPIAGANLGDATVKMRSMELFMRNAMIHLSTSFVVANGKISPFRILGVKTEPFLRENIDRMLASVQDAVPAEAAPVAQSSATPVAQASAAPFSQASAAPIVQASPSPAPAPALTPTSVTANVDRCAPEREFVEFPGTPGQYHRVGPDGNFVIQSFSGEEFGEVTIVDLRRGPDGKRVGRLIRTPMKNETYPVDGPWRLIASPGGGFFVGMSYFRFEDLLREGEKAKAFFTDNFGEFYHTSGELPDSGAERIKLRTLAWTKLMFKDFEVPLGSDGKISGEIRKSSIEWACNNIYGEEGFELVQPLLSKDGTEIAGIPQNARNPSMRVYKLLPGGDCKKVLDLGFQTSKVTFSHPTPGKQARIAFTDSSNVFVHDRDEGVTFPISDGKEGGMSYPGFTKDGRVIYLAFRGGKVGYSIVDPFQVRPSADRKCILESEVTEVEKRYAEQWKLQ